MRAFQKALCDITEEQQCSEWRGEDDEPTADIGAGGFRCDDPVPKPGEHADGD
jgi:hypothetical protein